MEKDVWFEEVCAKKIRLKISGVESSFSGDYEFSLVAKTQIRARYLIVESITFLGFVGAWKTIGFAE